MRAARGRSRRLMTINVECAASSVMLMIGYGQVMVFPRERGHRGAFHQRLLVQHADQDRSFQKKCLRLMEAAPDGEVSKQDVAFLTDRVLLADGKKQRYGTQFKQSGRRFVPEPLEDEATVDARRARMGLPP